MVLPDCNDCISQVYLSDTFNSGDDFSTYQEILDVPGDATALTDSYDLPVIHSGRYIVVQRQLINSFLDIREIEISTIENA